MFSMIFGGTKKKSTVQEPSIVGDTQEGFSIVSRGPVPLYPPLQQSNLPYNIIPQPTYNYMPAYSGGQLPGPTIIKKDNCLPANPLDSVPFKLCSSITTTSELNNELKLIKNSIENVKNGLRQQVYNYDFRLERSFLHENNV